MVFFLPVCYNNMSEDAAFGFCIFFAAKNTIYGGISWLTSTFICFPRAMLR